MQKLLILALALLAPLVPAAPAAAQTSPPEGEVRALWVTRWDFTKPEHVAAIMKNAAEANFNVVLFQVRGNATAFYPSEIEPWAWELTGEDPRSTGRDPGWDPLKVAVEEGHKNGLEVHAWANVFPAWQSQRFPPSRTGQLWWSHPEWFMHDAAGNKMIPRDQRQNPNTRDWYSFINPAHPEVQEYLADVFVEMVTNYDIDGVHYDYIRYPAEITEVAEAGRERARKMGNWSYDPISLKRFKEETGKTPDEAPEEWTRWRGRQVSDVAKLLSERMRAVKPDIIISAAVMPDPEDARDRKYQDYLRWLEEGWIDAVFTMNYAAGDTFENRLQMLVDRAPEGATIAQGLGGNHPPEVLADQIEKVRELGYDGIAIFAYSHLFERETHTPKPPLQPLKQALGQPTKPEWD